MVRARVRGPVLLHPCIPALARNGLQALYGFSPFPLVVNISLPIVESYDCLPPTADVCITYLPQCLGLPTMAKSYSTSTQTIRTHLGVFRVASSFSWAEFHISCSWIYRRRRDTCRRAPSILAFSVLNHSPLLCWIYYDTSSELL